MIRKNSLAALVLVAFVLPAQRTVAQRRRPITNASDSADDGQLDASDADQIVEPKRPARHERTERARPPTADEKAEQDETQLDSRRIQVFLVPVGDSSSLAAGKAQAALEAEVAKLPGYHPVDLVKELQVPPPERDRRQLSTALRVESDGDQQLSQRNYDEAANRYRKAVKLLEKAGNALTNEVWADAWTRLAVALELSGEDADSKAAFQEAARADLAGVVDGRKIDARFGAGLDTAREEIRKGPDGALSVVTSPPGARVFLGGVYKGATPITIEHVAAGENFLRLDRPGAIAVVRLVDVKEADDTPVRVPMDFTDEARRLQATLVQVPHALDAEKGIPDMLKALGRRFRLERAVFATVEMVHTGIAELRMVVVDFPREARLADEKQRFPIDSDHGAEEIAPWARKVLDAADRSRNRSANDPLDRFDGTEHWYQTQPKPRHVKDDPDAPAWEQHHYKPEQADKPGTTDPLDGEDGTEDW